jgi:hypothetical protein
MKTYLPRVSDSMIVAVVALASAVALDASAGEPVGFREQCRKQRASLACCSVEQNETHSRQ